MRGGYEDWGSGSGCSEKASGCITFPGVGFHYRVRSGSLR